jgi:alpha,alpha-trehalose phosphorylase
MGVRGASLETDPRAASCWTGRSLKCVWTLLGLAGMRERDGALSFAPCLPQGLTRLAFSVRLRGRCLRVETTAATTSYQLTAGTEALTVFHYGEAASVTLDKPTVRTIPPERVGAIGRPSPTQPAGREPRTRNLRNDAGVPRTPS